MTATKNQTIQPQFGTIGGLSIRFAESEDRADHALLLNRWWAGGYATAGAARDGAAS